MARTCRHTIRTTTFPVAQWAGPVVDLGWERFVAVLPRSDPLAGRRGAVALEELADRDWVLFGPDHGLTTLVLEVCARAGFAPRRTVRTGQVAAAAHLAAAGLGVTLIPDNIVPHGLNAAVRNLKPPLARQLVAFTRPGLAPARPRVPRRTTSPDMADPTTLSKHRSMGASEPRRAGCRPGRW
jgi:DNA-binding transcriptional LysR family regulator